MKLNPWYALFCYLYLCLHIIIIWNVMWKWAQETKEDPVWVIWHTNICFMSHAYKPMVFSDHFPCWSSSPCLPETFPNAIIISQKNKFMDFHDKTQVFNYFSQICDDIPWIDTSFLGQDEPWFLDYDNIVKKFLIPSFS